jgi:hypothetical protein
MFTTIDRMMAIVAKGVITAVIDGFAAYACSVYMPPNYGENSPSNQDFLSSGLPRLDEHPAMNQLFS